MVGNYPEGPGDELMTTAVNYIVGAVVMLMFGARTPEKT